MIVNNALFMHGQRHKFNRIIISTAYSFTPMKKQCGLNSNIPMPYHPHHTYFKQFMAKLIKGMLFFTYKNWFLAIKVFVSSGRLVGGNK